MNGYPSEIHYVITSDGYILHLDRIPPTVNNNSNGKIVFLQHGILTTSFQWLISGPKNGLGKFLMRLFCIATRKDNYIRSVSSS